MRYSLREVLSMFPLAIFIIALDAIVHKYFSGYWSELITIFATTSISLVFANRLSVRNKFTDSAIILRNLLLITVGATLLSNLINTHNLNQNNFGSVAWTLCISIVGLLVTLLLNYSSDWDKKLHDKYYQYHPNSGFIKLLGILVIVALIAELYIHFGSQYIWIPSMTLAAFLWYFFEDPKIEQFLDNDILQLLFITPIIIAVISTCSEFWFHNIVFGFSLWQVLLGLGIILLILGAVLGYFVLSTRKKEAEAERIKTEAREAKQAEELVARELRSDEVREENMRLFQSIKNGDELSWDNIIKVYHQYDLYKNPGLLDIATQISTLTLQQLITVSKLKKQLFWDGYYTTALIIIEKIATKSNNDELLNKLISQLLDLTNFINQYFDFNGHNEALNSIVTNCPTLLKLLPAEIEEEFY